MGPRGSNAKGPWLHTQVSSEAVGQREGLTGDMNLQAVASRVDADPRSQAPVALGRLCDHSCRRRDFHDRPACCLGLALKHGKSVTPAVKSYPTTAYRHSSVAGNFCIYDERGAGHLGEQFRHE